MPDTILLVALALGFAWSMGAHYTGACMGMPVAMEAIGLRPALWLMAMFVLIGAVFLSHSTLRNIGVGLLPNGLNRRGAAIVVGVSFLITTIFTQRKIPTSTIQILVFAVIGAGVARGAPIAWPAILLLILLWLLAPLVAFALGFAGTKLADLFVPTLDAKLGLSFLLAGGVAASLAMGANDVSNATAMFLAAHVGSVWFAAIAGGIGLAAGVLSWGRPLLVRVASEVVRLDMSMAIAAKAAQALVVFLAVSLGGFTSMNQALIGAMAGAGLARGSPTIDQPLLFAILRGWLIGPIAGFAGTLIVLLFLGRFG